MSQAQFFAKLDFQLASVKGFAFVFPGDPHLSLSPLQSFVMALFKVIFLLFLSTSCLQLRLHSNPFYHRLAVNWL